MVEDGAAFDLIDVREPAEAETVRIPGARLVPRGRILDGSALAELPRDRRLVLHCRSGVRSAECLAVLRAAGFVDAVHLAGGVLAWIDQLEPSRPVL
jgi:adenylyltransferase/sulfurtransferase